MAIWISDGTRGSSWDGRWCLMIVTTRRLSQSPPKCFLFRLWDPQEKPFICRGVAYWDLQSISYFRQLSGEIRISSAQIWCTADSNFEKCLTLLSIPNRVSVLNIFLKDIQWKKSCPSWVWLFLNQFVYRKSLGSLISAYSEYPIPGASTIRFPFMLHKPIGYPFAPCVDHVDPGVSAEEFVPRISNNNVPKCNQFGAMLYLLKYDWIRRV